MPRTALLALARQSLRHRHPIAPTYHHNRSLLQQQQPPQRTFSMSLSTQYSSSSKDEPDNAAAADAATSQTQQQGLPAPGEGTPITLDVSGEGSTIKLSDLGPLVVNVDGTVSRINNWKEMTEAERETTVRMVRRRNKQRLDAFMKQKEEQGGAQ
ncbi:hypothetical protein PWT90_05027 [Aphanocladium album]|nr:hypothetical protein PWT90_05027 [Aphanocladium album]